MEQPLIALRVSRSHVHDLHRLVPARGRSHGTVIRSKADCIAGLAEVLAAELADVVLAAAAHLRR